MNNSKKVIHLCNSGKRLYLVISISLIFLFCFSGSTFFRILYKADYCWLEPYLLRGFKVEPVKRSSDIAN